MRCENRPIPNFQMSNLNLYKEVSGVFKLALDLTSKIPLSSSRLEPIFKDVLPLVAMVCYLRLLSPLYSQTHRR